METGPGGVRKEHLDPLAIALLLTCCAFWGFQQVLVKATLAEMAPIFMAGVRFAGAAAVLWLWCLWRGVPLWRRDGSLRPGTAPLWAALVLPWFIQSERLSAVQWLGLLLAFLAVGYTLREGFAAGQTAQQHWGDLLGIGGAIAWALTTVVLRTTRLTRLGAE